MTCPNVGESVEILAKASVQNSLRGCYGLMLRSGIKLQRHLWGTNIRSVSNKRVSYESDSFGQYTKDFLQLCR